jgi:hypothetical protein
VLQIRRGRGHIGSGEVVGKHKGLTTRRSCEENGVGGEPELAGDVHHSGGGGGGFCSDEMRAAAGV